jgi:hypothetical protein
MKKLFLVFFITLFFSALTLNAQDRHHNQNGRGHEEHGNGNGIGHHRGGIGVPLDGGLLIVLGAAGASYLAFRKRKITSDISQKH